MGHPNPNLLVSSHVPPLRFRPKYASIALIGWMWIDSKPGLLTKVLEVGFGADL